MDQGKHGRVRPDTDREGQDGHGAEAWIPSQPPKGVAHIAAALIDEWQAPYVTMGFAQLRHPTELQARRAPRLFLGHAAAAMVLLQHREMRGQLLIQVAIEVRRPESGQGSRCQPHERAQHVGLSLRCSCVVHTGVSRTLCGM